MNTPQLPSVELIQGNPASDPTGPPRGRRWKVFFGVLLLASAVGLAFVYARPAVYRAVASVLTVKPKAIDQRSEAADIEHVAIQGRLLLGEDLLGRLAELLTASGESELNNLDRLRSSLDVVAVPDTNLLELRAEGGDPQQLQRVVNRWAESYEDFRAEEIEAATGRITAELEDRQRQLQSKIDRARAELFDFRAAHDIVSLEREENRSLAGLKGLNNSLNKARERLVEAEARQVAIAEAIARGETVIPSELKDSIATIRLSLQRKRLELARLLERYTQVYIDRDPVLKAIPDEIRALSDELELALAVAKTTLQDESAQEVEAARVSLRALEEKLTEDQRQVQSFTDRFKEFKALEEGLARLERLHAESMERLANIQVSNLKKYPPIQIVDWARVPTQPISPNYERDAMITLGSALALALFVTWLVEYLSERSRQTQTQPYLGVRIIQGEQPQALSAATAERYIGQPARADVPGDAPAANLPVLPRELAGSEVKSLLAVADPGTAGYAALLLSGVSPYELPLLHMGSFDHQQARIDVPGAAQRELAIVSSVWRWLEPLLTGADGASLAIPLPELDAHIRHAAQDAQLADPGSVNALAIWHSYVVYLARQGVDGSALARRVGHLPPGMLGTLMHFAPPGGNRPLADIDFTYPALSV